MQKMKKSRICKNADDYGLFHLFLPSCTGKGHLFPCRYEVGWTCILSVDLFPHTSKGPVFTALPGFVRFSRQKMDFPHFREEGNPSIFYNFWLFFAIFATKQHHRLHMHRLNKEIDSSIKLVFDIEKSSPRKSLHATKTPIGFRLILLMTKSEN